MGNDKQEKIIMESLYHETEEALQQSISPRKKATKIISNVAFSFVVISILSVTISFSVIKAHGEIPFLFNYSLQRIETGSMEPTLKQGSLILAKKFNKNSSIVADYSNGTIITFYNYEHILVTHRCVETLTIDDEIYYVTKGDNNGTCDTYIKDGEVTKYPLPREDIVSTFVRRVF
ncbi:MAG: signal peptidase I [Bacilli bacterium]|nr:signal peptidase I [Bacilli bacterium]